MTLTTRLNLFFLTALAALLVTFSSALYLLARGYFERQNDQRLESALSTLVAATEIAPEGVIWDLAERRLSFGGSNWPEQVAWIISDDDGQVIDRSNQPDATDFPVEAQGRDQSESGSERFLWKGEPWQFRRQRIETPDGTRAKDNVAEGAGQSDDEHRHRAISIVAAIPLAPTQAVLRNLAFALVGLSLVVWIVGLFAGWAVCRRALAPVTSMAAAAREMDASELARRLPVADSGDELADLGRAFNSLIDRLQQSFERQRQFTGDASHQLRTPLAAILGQIEVALRRERTSEEYLSTLATVQQTSEHLRQIIEALLFLARADEEARLPERECIDLAAWLSDHRQTWSKHERFKDIVIESQESDAYRVLAQRVLLGELVNILLDNACKYSPPGTPIKLRLWSENKQVCLEVNDQGQGIAAPDMARLFTPFFRSADARRQRIDGVGLGLSIAKRLATAFGGTLSAASRQGAGSCFTLRLPRASEML